MSTLRIFFCAALAALAAEAAQAQIYFRADTGLSFSTGADFKDNDLICGNANCTQPGSLGDFGNAFIAGTGVGYRMGSYVRTDITLGYRRYKLDQFDAAVPSNHFTAEIKSLAAMLNLYLEFPSGVWTPFIGVGGGQARNRISALAFDDGAGFKGDVPGGTKSGAAWAAMLGAGFPLRKGGEFEIGYRYVDLGKVEVPAGGDVTVGGAVVPPPYAGASGNLRAHELMIGVRF